MKTEPGLSAARYQFKVTVLALDRGCICGLGIAGLASLSQPCEGELRAHHVVYQKHLRGAGLDAVLWDPANGAAVCERHHRRHHAGYEPIPQGLLPQRCLDFAVEHDLDRLLDRFYPILP